LIVDGLNLAFRWKHQEDRKAKTEKRRPRYNFKAEYVKTAESLAKSYDCGDIAILGDGGSHHRKELYPLYKANRAEKYADQTPEEEEDFQNFLGEFQNTMTALKEKEHLTIRYHGVEADDIAAVICLNKNVLGLGTIWLVSSDKDWDLLVKENISRFSTVTRKETTIENWDEHYDFDREYFLTFKCLTGDKGDNVPGVNGIGPKRASSLISDYGDVFDIMMNLPIESRYKFMQNLNEFGNEKLGLNIELMDLSYDPDAQVLGHTQDILGLVIKHVDKN
tara:strand:+ start:5178 stop:6011 length:834 start_codon:yes stop_codon:yes gene_type:complete